MILHNTTFLIDSSLEQDFLNWLRIEFLAEAINHGFERPQLAKIRVEQDDNAVSYALHLYADNDCMVDEWINSGRSSLMQKMFEQWNERAVAFSTSMEIVDLGVIGL